jgi:hypothetical protein
MLGRDVSLVERESLSQVCEMHLKLEELKFRGAVSTVPICDGHWRTWLIPVQILAKLLFLVFMHDGQAGGSIHYDDRGHSVKLMWPDGVQRIYFIEIKERRAMDEPFHLQLNTTSLLERISGGLARLCPQVPCPASTVVNQVVILPPDTTAAATSYTSE